MTITDMAAEGHELMTTAQPRSYLFALVDTVDGMRVRDRRIVEH